MFDVTLTFDNGPTPEVTPLILDILAANNIRSTFFVVGKHASLPGRRELMERAVSEGHWIGNHTWTHSVPLGQRDEHDMIEMELEATQRVIGDLAGEERLFRPFGGGGNLDKRLLNDRVQAYLEETRSTCVLWNNVPKDWVDLDGWVDVAIASCKSRDWSVTVLHDLPATGAAKNLQRFIDEVDKCGGRFRQDFAPECLPMVGGEVVGDIDAYVTRYG